jgi:hypothetical protein
MSSEITNDQQLRTALNDLALEAQRRLGARFVASVSHLSANPILTHGLQVAENAQASAAELDNAYKACKKLAIDTYTACGRDADWAMQAEHFVAAAVAACLLSEDQFNAKDNIAWKAAMQARMARNCEMILNDKGAVDNEANRQYAIAMEFLG